jgi:hypothetical protein
VSPSDSNDILNGPFEETQIIEEEDYVPSDSSFLKRRMSRNIIRTSQFKMDKMNVDKVIQKKN